MLALFHLSYYKNSQTIKTPYIKNKTSLDHFFTYGRLLIGDWQD